MKAKRTFQPLGELEQAVMNIVWSHFPTTARDVCGRMTGRWERAYTTIMTTMDRLHRKGLLRREKDGLAWRYEPALSKASFEKALADGLASNILEAHGETALAAFVDAAAEVDEGLLDRLRQLIERRGRDGPSPSIDDSDRPPHRSQRAELPHWALTLGCDAEALVRPGMNDGGRGEPASDDSTHPLPVEA